MAIALAGFAIVFGARHLDTTERHEGMVAAIAFESMVKLLAFLGVGAFVVYGLFNGLGDIFTQARARPELAVLLKPEQGGAFSWAQWLGLMVLAMLALLAFQVGTGLCASDIDSYLWDGPLAKRIGADLSETIPGWHKAAFDVLLMAVITHVTAIVFYLLFKKRNLVKAMLTGQQIFDAPVQRLAFVRGSIALLALLVAAGAVYGLVTQV